MNNLAYGITEDQHYQLYIAKHLASVLMELSLNGYDKNNIQLNPESLGVVFGLLHENLSIEYTPL